MPPLSAILCTNLSPKVRDKEPHACVAALAAAGPESFRATTALGDRDVLALSFPFRRVVNKPVFFSGLGDRETFFDGGANEGVKLIDADASAPFPCDRPDRLDMSVSDFRVTSPVARCGRGGGLGRDSSG